MIVDDDDVIAFGLQDYLNLRGCKADTARDYESARNLVNSLGYAVAIVEVVVTGCGEESGIAFLNWLREASPKTAIVVLTAFRTACLEELLRSLGISHLFDKPKRFDEIVDVVSRLTKASRATAIEVKAGLL